MEVHAHTHTQRKKWFHYFWEFLMLFLAVFAGFIAENQREHFVEHQREKQYIRSFIRDVATDTSNINKMLGWYRAIESRCDSVLMDFGSTGPNNPVKTSKWFSDIILGYPDFIYSDRTMQQLKNAGGLRLIRDLAATDSIMNYDAAVRDILLEEGAIDIYWQKLVEFANSFINFHKIDEERKMKTIEEIEIQKISVWLITDSKDFQHLYNLVKYYKKLVNGYIDMLIELKRTGNHVILLLKNHYHLN